MILSLSVVDFLLATLLLTTTMAQVLSLGLETASGYSALPPCATAAAVEAIYGYHADCQSMDPPVTYVACLCSKDYNIITSSIAFVITSQNQDIYPCGTLEVSSAWTVISNFCSANNAALMASVITAKSASTASCK